MYTSHSFFIIFSRINIYSRSRRTSCFIGIMAASPDKMSDRLSSLQAFPANMHIKQTWPSFRANKLWPKKSKVNGCRVWTRQILVRMQAQGLITLDTFNKLDSEVPLVETQEEETD